MATELKCKHQCSKCGILYRCKGCFNPFFTDKHDCKFQRSYDSVSIISFWMGQDVLTIFPIFLAAIMKQFGGDLRSIKS